MVETSSLFQSNLNIHPLPIIPSLAAERGGRCDDGLQPGGESPTDTQSRFFVMYEGNCTVIKCFWVCRCIIDHHYATTHQWGECTDLKKHVIHPQRDHFLGIIYSSCMTFAWWIIRLRIQTTDDVFSFPAKRQKFYISGVDFPKDYYSVCICNCNVFPASAVSSAGISVTTWSRFQCQRWHE